jgi:hypothetical protein
MKTLYTFEKIDQVLMREKADNEQRELIGPPWDSHLEIRGIWDINGFKRLRSKAD